MTKSTATITVQPFTAPAPPAWIAGNSWSRAGWDAGWAHLRLRVAVAIPAPECSHTWEECATSCPASEAWRSKIDARMTELAAVAARAIEWSQSHGAEGDGYFGTRSCWINSAIRAVDELAI
jgi:hypothetical protein